jgi:hypothetical protein
MLHLPRLLVLPLLAGLFGACDEENPPPPWRRDGATDCTKAAYFLDDDGDGYGNPAQPQEACLPPEGYVANDLDCDDTNPDVWPGQSAFFEVTTPGWGFDYNCDGVAQKEYPSLVSCISEGMICEGHGWAETIPDCGEPGDFVGCTKPPGVGPECIEEPSTKIQGCH